MKVAVLLLVALLAAGAATPIYAQALTDADVERAIAIGKQKKAAKTTVVADGRWFTVEIVGAFARVALDAERATAEYKSFLPTDVTAETRSSTLTVFADPYKPTYSRFGGWRLSPLATHVVLLPYGRKVPMSAAVQPSKIEAFPVSWGNAEGGTFQGQRVQATFDVSQLPPGDFFVVVIADTQEDRVLIEKRRRPKVW